MRSAMRSRETDLVGWYKESAILAVIFTEVSLIDEHAHHRGSGVQGR